MASENKTNFLTIGYFEDEDFYLLIHVWIPQTESYATIICFLQDTENQGFETAPHHNATPGSKGHKKLEILEYGNSKNCQHHLTGLLTTF